MSNRFYSLPQSIVINIYEYDNTYKEIFNKKILKELWQKNWFLWNIKWNTKYQIKSPQPIEYTERMLFIVHGLAVGDCIYDTINNTPLCNPQDLGMFNGPDVLDQGRYTLWMQYKPNNSSTVKCLRVNVYDRDQDTNRETKKSCYYNEKRIMFVYLNDDIQNDIWQ